MKFLIGFISGVVLTLMLSVYLESRWVEQMLPLEQRSISTPAHQSHDNTAFTVHD